MSAIIEAKNNKLMLFEQLKNSVSTVIVDYRGLTVAEVTELRSQLREAVLSTKFTKHYGSSCEQAGIEGLDEFLTGPVQLQLKM